MPGTRRFFLTLLAASLLFVLGMWLAFPQGLIASDAVMRGFQVWQRRGCAACHTLFAQGGGHAPDLTRYASDATSVVLSVEAWHTASGVPALNERGLTAGEMDDLEALLTWAAETDLSSRWPPVPADIRLPTPSQQAGGK